jgi:hypothetical protein
VSPARTMGLMPAIVILRVKNPGREATRLLKLIEAELGVGAQAQTAGYVPISLDTMEPAGAHKAVEDVLDTSGIDWREHLELRS